jgi:glycosyltransferase involved in cell wall biosynthesis
MRRRARKGSFTLKNILFLHAGAELYGADVILLEILKGLDKDKYKPYVVLPNDGPLVKAISRLGVEVHVYDYPILRRKFFTPTGIIQYAASMIKSIRYLRKFIEINNIEVIHSNTFAVLEGGILHLLLQKKHFWHVHEIIKNPRFLNSFYRRFAPKMATKVICVSNAVKENLVEGYGKFEDKLIVVHNGIDSKRFKIATSNKIRRELNISDDEILIGMTGRVNKIKGQDFLLDAAEEIIKKYKNVSFLLVGGVFKGQEKLMMDLLHRSSHEGLKGKVYISDFRTDTEEIYNNLDIFVLPSIQPDSFPTVVLEAMSSGLPVVANVTGGVKEMVEDNGNGFLLYDIDKNKMGGALEKLIEDEGLRKKFGKRSREIIEDKFTINGFYDRLNKIYEKI